MHHACSRSGQLTPSFNKSAQNWLPTPRKAFPATEVASENSGPRHGNHHVRTPILLRGGPRKPRIRRTWRIPQLLAAVLRQGLRPLPAGTALYAGPGSGLARQARDGVTGGSCNGRRYPARQDPPVDGAFLTTSVFSAAGFPAPRGRLRARALRATMAASQDGAFPHRHHRHERTLP